MATALQIDILKQIYKYWVTYDAPIQIDKIKCIISQDELTNELKLLEVSELVNKEGSSYSITLAGRSKFSVVLTGGVYDLIHQGHIVTLTEAASHGDFLIVVIARDLTAHKRKRLPFHPEEDRVSLLNAITMVDAAISGDEIDHMRVVRRIKPDVIALGADQDHIEAELKIEIKDQGFPDTKIIRLEAEYEGLATTKLINKIIERN